MPSFNDQPDVLPPRVHIPFLVDYCKELTSGTSSEAVPFGSLVVWNCPTT